MNKIILVFFVVCVFSCVLLIVYRATEEDFLSNGRQLSEKDSDDRLKAILDRSDVIDEEFASKYINSFNKPDFTSRTDEQKKEIVQKAIKSLTEIIEMFHKNLIFPLLYYVIEEINVYANQYKGSARESLRSLWSYTNLMRNSFQEIVVPAFEWCSNGISDDLYGVSETALIVGEEKLLRSFFYSDVILNTNSQLENHTIEAFHEMLEDYESNGREDQKLTNFLELTLRIVSHITNFKKLGLQKEEINFFNFIGLLKSDDKVKELIKVPSNLLILHELKRACHGYVNWFKSDLKEYARNNELCDEEIRIEFKTIENDFLNLTNNIGDYYNGLDSVRDDRLEKTNKEANNYFTNKTETSRKVLELVLQNQSFFETIRNGIESLAHIIEKFHSEFDKKLKFTSLYEAIDEIDKYASNYQGAARNKLLNLGQFNPIMKEVFQKCVTPVFEWCSNGYLDDINHVLRKPLSAGEENAARSINYLKVLLFQRSYVQRALNDTLGAVQEDYRPNGFYGKQGIQLTNGLEENLRRAIEVAYQEDLGLDEDERNILAFLGFQPKDNIGAWINWPMYLSSLRKLANACRNYKIWFESGLKEYAQSPGLTSGGNIGLFSTTKVPPI